MGSFSSKAPALIQNILNISSTADGLSLNSVIMQCAIKMTYFDQVWAVVREVDNPD